MPERVMIQVKDGHRLLQFDGELLAHSSSWRAGSYRWIEFSLYRTEAGSYVIARIGQSLLYHLRGCKVVSRNALQEAPRSDLELDAHPCELCQPELQPDFPIVYPERPRYHAQVCDGPDAVLDALHRYDSAGSRYLTLVAARLLDDASEHDHRLEQAYKIETIL